MALSAGARLGPYEILAPLGAGGMGEVYRARDPRLKREVALKILPPELASKPERLERFEREAQSLAALNHPHIVTIFSVEEADGLRFLTMELVEGKTLAEVIPRGGLSLSRFFQIAIPLAEAVSAAHEKGIAHRDLKPGNVMVTQEGRVKVLDFGLAKLQPGAGATESSEAPTVDATDAGRVLGTAPYMSPEQVQARTVDHRSDVFSLGIMLYEMVTGDRPFQGATSVELASSILRDTPASVTERKADVPRDLGKLIKHCLEKEPKKRFQSTLDLANELEELRREVDTGEALAHTGASIASKRPDGTRRAWLVGGAIVAALALVVGYRLTRSPPPPSPEGTSPAERKMLVVLPFENLGAPEDAYFAAGMTEEITSRLARVGGLGVISRTSAVQYDRTGKTIREIGEDLGVSFVLEGTVRWDQRAEGAGRVRITPQLIRVADDTHLWANSYDRVLEDIFAAQSEIAQAVVEQLGVTLLPEERRGVQARPTENMEAYQAYLRGLEHLRDPDYPRESLKLALQMFERATELDPEFVAAHAMLADTHAALYQANYDRSPERLTRSRRAAERALELDPDSPEGHLALGLYYEASPQDDGRALDEYTLAARRRPNDSRIANRIGWIRLRQGRFEEAIGQFEKALELDPREQHYAFSLGLTYRILRRYAEAIQQFDLAISLAPDQAQAYMMKAAVYEEWGLLDEARKTLESAPKKDDRHLLLAWVLLEAMEGNYQAALDRLADAPEILEFTWGRFPRALTEANIYDSMGQPEQARASYEQALVVLEAIVEEAPGDDARMRLANAYAGLGRKADAIREARGAVERLPVSRDALAGPERVWTLATVYAQVGEYEAAIDQLEYLLSIPSFVSVPGRLRHWPAQDPLRDHPRFRKLLASGGPTQDSP